MSLNIGIDCGTVHPLISEMVGTNSISYNNGKFWNIDFCIVVILVYMHTCMYISLKFYVCTIKDMIEVLVFSGTVWQLGLRLVAKTATASQC